MAKDIEQAIEEVKGKKFGVSINNIIRIDLHVVAKMCTSIGCR